jgi:hypothetical protein
MSAASGTLFGVHQGVPPRRSFSAAVHLRRLPFSLMMGPPESRFYSPWRRLSPKLADVPFGLKHYILPVIDRSLWVYAREACRRCCGRKTRTNRATLERRREGC